MVIAHFSPVKTLGLVGFMLFAALFPIWAMSTGFHNRYGTDAVHDWVMWVWILFSPFLLVIAAAMVRAVFSNKGRAVWISQGNLNYASLYWPGSLSLFHTRALSDVASFGVGIVSTSGPTYLKGIFVRSKRGRVDAIPTYLLAEPRDAVLERLNQALAAQH
jgi:hypothetical protein